jgi:hypothetical protein
MKKPKWLIGIICRLFHKDYWYIGGINFETHCSKCGHKFKRYMK